MEAPFIRPRNVTFDRHVFLITKKFRGETVKHFYGKLKKLAENCNFENKEDTLLRDAFITNFTDPEIQKQLLKQTVERRQALTHHAGGKTSIEFNTTIKLLFRPI